MQGIFINHRRPKSKKEVKETARDNPGSVSLEATSILGNEYDGPLDAAPTGSYSFVGPCPHTKRSFYGTITVTSAGIKVS